MARRHSLFLVSPLQWLLLLLLTGSFSLFISPATAATSRAATVDAGIVDDVGVWSENTNAYFPESTSSMHRMTAGSIVALTDWYGDLSAGLLAVESGNATSEPTHVELWSNTATHDGSTRMTRQWAAEPVAPGVSVASAVTVDLRRSGRLDVLVQGSDGELYVMAGKGGNPVKPPSKARKLSITVAPAAGRTKSQDGESEKSGSRLSTRVRYAASPQVSVALLGSPYPSILFVNEQGALVELRWRGRAGANGTRPSAAAAARQEGLDDNHDENHDDDGDLIYAYDAYEIVPTTESDTGAMAASAVDGAPAKIGTGRRQLDPSSLVMTDVNGDCVSELLYAVRDYDVRTLSVYAYQPLGFPRGVSNGKDGHEKTRGSREGIERVTTTHVRLLTISEEEFVFGSLSVADVDGDGAADLLFPVRRRRAITMTNGTRDWNEDGDEAPPGYTGVAAFFSPAFAKDGCRATPATLSEPLFRMSDRVTVELNAAKCHIARSSSSARPLWMPDSTVRPLILRSGDYNRDGRVDLVVPSSLGPLTLTATGRRTDGAAFYCAPVSESMASTAASMESVARSDPFYTDAVPFFAVLSEDAGQLDIVLTSHARLQAPDATARTMVFRNDALPERNYFLLACVLNGVEPAREPVGRRRGNSGFGLGQPGAALYVAWEDARMHRKWHASVQLGHYVGHALRPPRELVGLGETFSYVRAFTVGIPASVGTTGAGAVMTSSVRAHTRQWPSYLVPNSQVFAVTHPTDAPGSWRLQLYLPTSRYRLLLGIAMLIALVGVGILIVLLRWQEMRVDYWEWKRH